MGHEQPHCSTARHGLCQRDSETAFFISGAARFFPSPCSLAQQLALRVRRAAQAARTRDELHQSHFTCAAIADRQRCTAFAALSRSHLCSDLSLRCTDRVGH
jgi:hypothetical protein